MSDVIVCKLDESSCGLRWPCIVCGGHSDKDLTASFTDADGDKHDVCWLCLRDPDGVQSRLEEHANARERNAALHVALLRELATKRWVLPTVDEWRSERRS